MTPHSLWLYSLECSVTHAKAQHRYVSVELECKKCTEGHTVIYDAITPMKRRRFGYYTNPFCVSRQVSSAEWTYEFIESAFEEMPNGLATNPFVPGAYDCRYWADELYRKIS